MNIKLLILTDSASLQMKAAPKRYTSFVASDNYKTTVTSRKVNIQLQKNLLTVIHMYRMVSYIKQPYISQVPVLAPTASQITPRFACMSDI